MKSQFSHAPSGTSDHRPAPVVFEVQSVAREHHGSERWVARRSRRPWAVAPHEEFHDDFELTIWFTITTLNHHAITGKHNII